MWITALSLKFIEKILEYLFMIRLTELFVRMTEMSKCVHFNLYRNWLKFLLMKCQNARFSFCTEESNCVPFIMCWKVKQGISFKMSTEILSNSSLSGKLKTAIFNRRWDLVINNQVEISYNQCEKITNFCEESNLQFKCLFQVFLKLIQNYPG